MESPQPTASNPFAAVPLPRTRAWLALIFAAAAFLSLGGMLEYGAGSPMTHGQGVASYWLAFFAFHAVSFGGAALFGAFPALAKRPVKAAWLLTAALLYGLAFSIWQASLGQPPLSAWLTHWHSYAPAALPLISGVLWGSLPEEQL